MGRASILSKIISVPRNAPTIIFPCGGKNSGIGGSKKPRVRAILQTPITTARTKDKTPINIENFKICLSIVHACLVSFTRFLSCSVAFIVKIPFFLKLISVCLKNFDLSQFLEGFFEVRSAPSGIRTRVPGLKSLCPRPLDDGGHCG
jgi:hypothetical protein